MGRLRRRVVAAGAVIGVALAGGIAAIVVTPFAQADTAGGDTAGAVTANGGTAGAVTALKYDLGDTAFDLGDPSIRDDTRKGLKTELRGIVHYPSRLPAGKMPLVMILHGQAYSCADEDASSWPCPAGVAEFPSYRGYDYLGDALARDGFVVVSIAASGLNHHMGVSPHRAGLINKHLAMWERFTTTGGGPLAGRFTRLGSGEAVRPQLRGHVDMTRVGTLGHSVGGEGVMRHASDKYRGDWPPGVRLRAVVPIASPYNNYDDVDDTGEGPDRDTSGVLVTGMRFAVVSATCWGSGDRSYFDNARGRTRQPSFLVRLIAGNHNFFNTVWTDDVAFGGGDDTNCPSDPGRPSAQAQRDFAVTYLKAFYRLALKDDRSGIGVLTGQRPIAGVTTEHEHLP